MKTTISNSRNKTKNLARNITAGTILASTVTSTDLMENFSTSITKPTSNILKTIENTSESIGAVFKNTAKGNILHTAGNIATIVPRAVWSIAEWTIKTAGHWLQYASGLSQVVWNQLTTTGQTIQQTFSTSDESPDIPHKETHLKDATNLWRDGTHGVLQSKEAPKSKFVKWMGNVKNSIVNIPMNIARIGTDIISTAAQRTRWVIEAIGWVPQDIKKSRSGVFTKWQSFGTKFGNIFTKWIRWSVKWVWRWLRNVANEWVLKTWAATVGIGANLIGRTIGNTIIPLFSTKAGRDQKDNILDEYAWFQKAKWYYNNTPTITASVDNTKKEDTDTKDEKKSEDTKKIESKDEKNKPDIKKEEKENPKDTEEKQEKPKEKEVPEKETIAPEALATIITGHTAIPELKKAFKNKDKQALEKAKDQIWKAQALEKTINKDLLTEEHQALFKEIKSTATDIRKLKYKLEDTKVIDMKETKAVEKKESNELMGEHINQEQRKFTKLYNNKEEIQKDDIEKRIKSLQWYHKSGGKIVFTGKETKKWEALSGKLDDITIKDNKVKVWFTTDDGQTHTDEIELNKLFDSKFSVHVPETKTTNITPENEQEKKAA